VEKGRIISLIVFYLLPICTYHCERIHSGTSENLRQILQRIARSNIREMGNEKNYITDKLHITVMCIPL
jgi:uncharacterized membrane protein YgaE (UPF0421/DUF939 family)